MSRTAQTPGRHRTTIWDNPDYEEHTMSEIREDQPLDDAAAEDVEGNRMLKKPGLDDSDDSDDVEGNRMLKKPGLDDSDDSDDVEGNRMLKHP